MKKLLLCVIPLLALLSCTDRVEGEFTADDRLNATISVVVPQLPAAQTQTRAMALQPQMQNLYLAVFDENGYLLEYVMAQVLMSQATQNGVEYEYMVNLTPTKGRTIVHFMGNAPESLHFGSETEVIGGLHTEGGNEAYWQRVELPGGIKRDESGALDASVAEALTGVKLIRNFAWINLKVGSGVDNFTIEKYCVVNTRTGGSVAPYMGSLSSQNPFAEYTVDRTYRSLVEGGYDGYIPAGAELNTAIPDESLWFNAGSESADNYAYFMYERETPLSNPSFILVKGTYTADDGTVKDTPSYYKVDLRDGSGDYFPIIRNFRYSLTLTSVKHEGHETAAAAAAGAGSGDVSTSIETEDFTNISNNVARLSVSYTDTTLVNQMNDLKLRYKFEVLGAADPVRNDDVTVTKGTADGGEVIGSYSVGTADTDGWREITIATTELGTARKSQDIIIKGEATVDGHTYSLDRKVTINLRPKYTMELVCDPYEIPNRLGSPFDLVIKVPGGLNKSMFPLEFQLEAVEQSMTPDKGDDLPVVTGMSIVPTKDKATIGFVKHLEWTDYEALANEGGYKSVPCHFKSNKDASATVIWAENKYFELASTTLGNYAPSTFSNLTFSPGTLPTEADQEVDFTFTMSQMPKQGYVTVALENFYPAEDENGETGLKYIGTEDGKALYSFNPSATTETLHLMTSTTDVSVGSVTLSAYQFIDASAELHLRYVIREGGINVGSYTNISNTSNVTFTIFTENPGTSTRNLEGITIGSFSARRGGSNGAEIEVSKEQYQTVMENGGNVYVRFSARVNNRTRYYVAEVSLEALLGDGVTIGQNDWEQQ